MPDEHGKSVRIVETTMLSPSLKLAVIEFRGREILVSASRQGLTRLVQAFDAQYPRKVLFKSEPGRYIVAECGVLLGSARPRVERVR